ncbi:Glutamate--tRNA ligase mitochondrial [Linderina macrospora]|uniref:Glutamate--tRNA ligase mitochondrial n=1 Tax=Linderina macrospora TaxID=4868 RepID=A0ACC1JFD0_9FUNG|nr:Glutamate--tRNA ligase mitochondrial [Linderina macrospora]
MQFQSTTGFDDAVLLKSDGLPTYHLANVVDDHYMRISHVLRGEEWLISTPKHRMLFHAFGWEPPMYAHLPLLMNSDGSKLSKRNSDGPVRNYIDKGYLPQALVNYVALLGWHPESTQEVFSLSELEEQFTLGGLSRSKSAVSRDRLDWLQKQHLRAAIADDQQVNGLAEQALRTIKIDDSCSDSQKATPETIVKALRLCGDRLAHVGDLQTVAPYLFADPDLSAEEAAAFGCKVPRDIQISVLRQALAQVSAMTSQPDFNPADAESWHAFPKTLSTALGVPPKYSNMMLRYALTGHRTGPALADLMAYLPVTCIQRRLQTALDH